MQSPRSRSTFIVGICALDKKARSKPMRNIIDRLISFNEFEAVIFGDKVILDEPVDSWPGCDFFISFFSSGFPLDKAIEYVKLRKPFCVNDLLLQQLLLDRRLVYITLDAIDVPTPPRLTVSRDGGPVVSPEMSSRLTRDFGMDLTTNLAIHKDLVTLEDSSICIGGQTMKRPFVEKPVNSENHEIYIYYPNGGARRLFRKIANKSSEYLPDVSYVREKGSFIYETFMAVDNAEDVKVYTIGPNYFHAETRKSPVVDGIVRRNHEGKEIRYVTKLSEEEQEIARRVCMAFGQTICGFDLLRVNGKTYVIDVNGWSFVKGNTHYYDMCARILRETFLRVSRKRKMKYLLPLLPVIENQWFVKKYIAVFRHADRTPKQKLKFHLLHDAKAFERFITLNSSNNDLNSYTSPSSPISSIKGKTGDAEVHSPPAAPPSEIMVRNPEKLHAILELTMDLIDSNSPDMSKLVRLRDVLLKKLRHADTKLQLKPSYKLVPSSEAPFTATYELTKMQIIVKWGGEFTHAGRHHSKDLGENLRQELYLTNKALLDDIKIYSSSERRVIATSEIFLKAFMTIAEIPSEFIKISKEMLDDNILAKDEMEIVKKKIKQLLQKTELAPDECECLPPSLREAIKSPRDALMQLIELLKYHQEIMRQNLKLLKTMPLKFGHSPGVSHHHTIPQGFSSTENYLAGHKWCCFDSAVLWEERWEKLFNEFTPYAQSCDYQDTSETPQSLSVSTVISPFETVDMTASLTSPVSFHNTTTSITDSSHISTPQAPSNSRTSLSLELFEPSKICELYDSLKYDVIHNRDYLEFLFTSQSDLQRSRESLKNLYRLSKLIYDFVGPQEYGISISEKLIIGKWLLKSLLKHLQKDVREAKLPYGPSCRLYFTKESHVYPLLNLVLYHFMSEEKASAVQVLELDYLTQISFEIYERRRHLASSSAIVSPMILSEPDISCQLGNNCSQEKNVPSNLSLSQPMDSDLPGRSHRTSLTPSGASTPNLASSSHFPTSCPSEFAIRIGLSPGANSDGILEMQMDQKHAISVAPRVWITDYIKLDDFLEKLEALLHD